MATDTTSNVLPPEQETLSARSVVIFKLENNTHKGEPESATVEAKGVWKSPPPAKWLPFQSGKWEEIPGKVIYLKNDAVNKTAVEIRGTNFATVKKGSTGTAYYPESGDTGSWDAVDVVE